MLRTMYSLSAHRHSQRDSMRLHHGVIAHRRRLRAESSQEIHQNCARSEPCALLRRPHRAGLYVRSPAGLKLRDEMVNALTRCVRKVMPWLQASDHPAIERVHSLRFSQTMFFRFFRAKGVTSDGVEPRRILDDYRKLRSCQSWFYNRALRHYPCCSLAKSRQRAMTTRSRYSQNFASQITDAPADDAAIEAAATNGDGDAA